MSQNTASDDVLIVIVNYRTARFAADCLHSLQPEVLALDGVRVVVVDGASGDGSVEHLMRVIRERHYGDWATLMPLDRNGGFAYANNAAIAPTLAGPERPQYVYLLNPDTIALPGALAELLAFMRTHPYAGVAGSRCENADGTVRRTAFRFHSALGELESEAGIGPLSRALEHWVVAPPVGNAPHRTDWVSGAAMLVRSEVFDAIGLLDDGYFLYYEETDFARRAAAAGFECWYVPESRIVHYCGQASGVTQVDGSIGRVPRYFYESRRRYFTKHHGRLYAIGADLAWLFGGLLRGGRWLVGAPRVHPRANATWTSFDTTCVHGLRDERTHRTAASHRPRLHAAARRPRTESDRHRLLGARRGRLPTFDRDLLQPGLWAVLVHRFGNWRMGIRGRPARIPASVLYKVLATGILWLWGIQLEYTVKLGRRVRIWHHGGMVFGASAIGDDVHLRQNTTFGSARLDARFAKPTIGDRVDVGCGAVVLGDVHVGDDSVIGANAVVIRDVPPRSVAAGVPARIIKTLEPG